MSPRALAGRLRWADSRRIENARPGGGLLEQWPCPSRRAVVAKSHPSPRVRDRSRRSECRAGPHGPAEEPLALQGRGAGVRVNDQRSRILAATNRFESLLTLQPQRLRHGGGFLQNLQVRETHQPDPALRKSRRTGGVACDLRRVVVLPTIQFNGQPQFWAIEIEHVRFHGVLAAELDPIWRLQTRRQSTASASVRLPRSSRARSNSQGGNSRKRRVEVIEPIARLRTGPSP